MVDSYEYSEGTLNSVWNEFEIKEDEQNGRLVIQLKNSERTELFDFDTSGNFTASAIHEMEYISEPDDLPDASSGKRQLLDNTIYYFTDIIVDSSTLVLGDNTILVGPHAGQAGFIHTGGNNAIEATNVNVFINYLYLHAPGGTVLDVSGTTTDELILTNVTFSDAAGVGEMAKVGTIDGFRVPTIDFSNFENFADGLTFTGSPEKIFFLACAYRNVTQAGATILDFDAGLTCPIVDIDNGYVKGVQSDTTVVNVDVGATISEVFKYSGVTHDDTVTKANILTGAAESTSIGYTVRDSYPLADSGTIGELSLDASAAIPIVTQNEYVQIDTSPTSLGPDSERITQVSDGVLRYDGKEDVKVAIEASASIDTGNNQVGLAVAVNGTVRPTSEMRVEGASAAPAFLTSRTIENLSNGDTISAKIRNTDSTTDLTVYSMILTIKD